MYHDIASEFHASPGLGLQPKASCPARRFAPPAVVFNIHSQFEALHAASLRNTQSCNFRTGSRLGRQRQSDARRTRNRISGAFSGLSTMWSRLWAANGVARLRYSQEIAFQRLGSLDDMARRVWPVWLKGLIWLVRLSSTKSP